MRLASSGLIAALVLSSPAAAAAAAAPAAPPPPTPDQIKACMATIGPQWTLDWKTLTIGAPRPPRNNYEALNTSALGPLQQGMGYPIHVAYVLNGQWLIESDYFIIRNRDGRWQIPALCVVP